MSTGSDGVDNIVIGGAEKKKKYINDRNKTDDTSIILTLLLV